MRYKSRLKRQSEIIKNQICDEWIALRMEQEKRMAANYQMKMYHPLLNEKFIELFLLQDPMYFADNKKNMRKLHRSSFFDYLPKELRSNYKNDLRGLFLIV